MSEVSNSTGGSQLDEDELKASLAEANEARIKIGYILIEMGILDDHVRQAFSTSTPWTKVLFGVTELAEMAERRSEHDEDVCEELFQRQNTIERLSRLIEDPDYALASYRRSARDAIADNDRLRAACVSAGVCMHCVLEDQTKFECSDCDGTRRADGGRSHAVGVLRTNALKEVAASKTVADARRIAAAALVY